MRGGSAALHARGPAVVPAEAGCEGAVVGAARRPPLPVNRRPGPLAPGDLDQNLAQHHERCFAWAMSCCGWNRAEAEDVVQTTYLKVLDGRARFAGRSSFGTWLLGVVRRTAQERRRQAWRRDWLRRSRAEELAPSPPPALSAESETLRRELAALPQRQRQVLHLVFYTELSIAESAEVMGVSVGTARTHYERGKRRLRERIGTPEPAREREELE